MSKSSPAGCIFLLDPLKTIEKKVKSAVTDSETEVRFDLENKPGVSNLLTILSTVTGEDVASIEARFAGQMYGPLKKETAEAVVAFAEPFQNRVNELLGDKAELERLMRSGAERAAAVASVTVRDVFARVGLVPGA